MLRSLQSSPAAESRVFSHLKFTAAAAAIACGLLVLLGWIVGRELLKCLGTGTNPLHPVTALGLVLGGFALRAVEAKHSRYRGAARACAGIVALLAAISLSAFATNFHEIMSRLLFHGAAATTIRSVEAFTLFLVATAVLAGSFERRLMILIGQSLASSGIVAACFSLLRLAYGIDPLSSAAVFVGFTFLLLSVGAVCLHPEVGFLAAISAPNAGGSLLRRCLPGAILIPIALGALPVFGERFGLLTAPAGVALMAVGTIITFLAALRHVARLFSALHEERELAIEALAGEREFLRVVLENVHEGVLACNADGVVTVLNRAGREIHGLAKRSVPAGKWAETFSLHEPNGVALTNKNNLPLFRALEGEMVRDAEMEVPGKDGSSRRIIANGQALFDPSGKKLGAVVVLNELTQRQRTEATLRMAEQRLSNVLSGAPLIVWALDAQGIFTFCDGRALEDAAINPGMVLGRSAFDVFPADSEVFVACDRALGGEDSSCILELNGCVFNTSWRAAREGARITGVFGIATNISPQQVAEAALRQAHAQLEETVAARTAELCAANEALKDEIADREQEQVARRQIEERLNAIIDNGPAAIYVKDTLGRLLLVNRAYEAITGCPREQLLGKTEYDFYPLEAAESFAANDKLVRTGRKPIQCEETMLKNGVTHTYLSVKFPLCLPDGTAYAVCGISSDVTEFRRSMEQLQASEERFSLLVDGVEDYGIIQLDPYGRVASWNHGAERLQGYVAEEVLGRHISCFYPAEDAAAGKQQRELRAAEADGRCEADGWRVRKDGSRFFGNVILTALREEGGKLRGFAMVTRDITERKKAEESLLQAMQKVERANDAKSELLSRMSHELRTPLNAILGFGQVLEMDNLTGEQGNCVGQIMRAGQHLLGLVDEVLDLSQLGMSGVKLTVEPVRLEGILSDAVDRFRPDAQQRNIELILEPAVHELAVAADPQRLMQVLEIVISNAVKFNVPNGRITIWSAPAADGRHALSIRDTGVGIDRDQLGRLFNAFDRIQAEEAAVQGTGLGLAMAKQLVEAMSGTIRVESEKGAGCTVTLTLPLAVAAPAPAIEFEDEFPTLAAVGL